MNDEGSLVSEFYKGRSILITGATGFVGKVLVEKLLRSCSQLNCIYLLMRPKSGVDMKTRFSELLNASVSVLYFIFTYWYQYQWRAT